MYKIDNPINKAMDGMGQASGTYGRMMPNIKKPEDDPTAGGSLLAGAGGGVMGAQTGSLLGASAATETAAATTALGMGPAGWAAAGVAMGIGAYLFS